MAEDTRSAEAPPLASGADIRTFLIADVRGYTRFTRERGDEAAAELASLFGRIAGETIVEAGGRVLGLRGDEVAAAFDSPRGAVRAAVLLQRRFAEHTRDAPILPLRVGIGLDVGEAVRVADGYRGKALNLASRLCSLADQGDVLATEALVHLAGQVDDVRTRDRGRRRLKGFDEPVRVLQLVFPLNLPPAPARRRSYRRVGIAAAVAVGALVVAAVLLARGGSTPPKVVTAQDLAYGFYRVDPTSYEVSLVPGRFGGSKTDGAITFGFGKVWLATDKGVRALDANARSVGAIPLTGGGGALTTAPGHVWVSILTGTGRNAALPIGPNPNGLGNGILGTGGIPIQPFDHRTYPPALAFGYGTLWTWETGVDNCCFGHRLLWRVTLARHVVARLPTPFTLAVAKPEGVWEILPDNTIGRLNPTTNRREAHLSNVQGFTLALGGNAVWVGLAPTSGLIVEINPATNKVVNRGHISWNINALAFGFGSLWAVDRDRSELLRINPTTLRIVRAIHLGNAPPPGIAIGDGSIWLAFPSTPTNPT